MPHNTEEERNSVIHFGDDADTFDGPALAAPVDFFNDAMTIAVYAWPGVSKNVLRVFDELSALGVIVSACSKDQTLTISIDRLKFCGFILCYNPTNDTIVFVRLVDLPYLYNVIPFTNNVIHISTLESYTMLQFKCNFKSY